MQKIRGIDWILFLATLPLLAVGLVTMNSFLPNETVGNFFSRQLVWVFISIAVFFLLSFVDFRFLRRTGVVTSLFVGTVIILGLLFVIGSVFQGAQSWFNLGAFTIQPSDPAKIVVIILLAKYFSRRHIEIERIRHIVVSGLYIFLIFTLVLLQPDFGSSIIIALIWLGMMLVAGISKKHLAIIFILSGIVFAGLWGFGFAEYQKDRIRSFVDPLADVSGTGYNAYQSMIAVGSGEVWGKGVGFGTQSRLKFLPEYQTDFIFAAFAEEWGYIGALFLFILFGIIIWRIVRIAIRGETNFEVLFGLGVAIYFIAHFLVHVGMNVGLLPITGTTIPFLSYGGSHLITEFIALGILMGMNRYGRKTTSTPAPLDVHYSNIQ
ncbi:MAG: rod shape-determining protein RodA [Candidatus Paceibacterota bacterium]